MSHFRKTVLSLMYWYVWNQSFFQNQYLFYKQHWSQNKSQFKTSITSRNRHMWVKSKPLLPFWHRYQSGNYCSWFIKAQITYRKHRQYCFNCYWIQGYS